MYSSAAYGGRGRAARESCELPFQASRWGKDRHAPVWSRYLARSATGIHGAHVWVIDAKLVDVHGELAAERARGVVGRMWVVGVHGRRGWVWAMMHGAGAGLVRTAGRQTDVVGIQGASDVFEEYFHGGDVSGAGFVGPGENVAANSTAGLFEHPGS